MIHPGAWIFTATRHARANGSLFVIPTTQRHIILPNTGILSQSVKLSCEAASRAQCRHVSTTSLSMNMGHEIIGRSGRRYGVEQTLQDKGVLGACVYLAKEGETRFILKEVPQDWSARSEIYQIVAGSPHIRLPIDTISDRRMFVFEYIDDHLLNLVQKDMPLVQLKRILKDTLEGIAGLHERGVSHNDIKPNNILVQRGEFFASTKVERVLLTDLEDAVQLEPGSVLKGAPLGNFMWRSPEAHAEGPMETPSDIFAFGIVCIYAMTKTVIFAVNNPDFTDDDRLGTVIFRQMSYFSDEKGIEGLLQYLGENNPVREVFEAIEESCRDVPKEPFTGWQMPGLDNDFKNLVASMTKLDPRKRITAREGLAHPWFRDV